MGSYSHFLLLTYTKVLNNNFRSVNGLVRVIYGQDLSYSVGGVFIICDNNTLGFMYRLYFKETLMEANYKAYKYYEQKTGKKQHIKKVNSTMYLFYMVFSVFKTL